MINKWKFSLVVGCFMSFIHLIWILMIAIFPAAMQWFLIRIFNLHALKPVYFIVTPTRGNSILLVVITFVVGRLIGIVLSTLWNRFVETKKK